MGAEADLIRDAARRVLNGETLVAVVGDWNDRGVTTTTGGPWRINALSALLIQPRLIGLDGAPEVAADEAVPAILDRVTYERLLTLRRQRRREPDGRSGTSRRYLLSGLLRCWRCGARLGGAARASSAPRSFYRCPSRGAGGCSGVAIPAELAEAAARDAVAARVDDPGFVRGVEARASRVAEEEHRVAALLTDAVMGRRGVTGPDGLWTGDHQIDEDAWRRLRRQVEERVDGSELADQTLLTTQRKLCRTGTTLRAHWDEMVFAERRAAVEAVVDHFVVLAARPGPGMAPVDRVRPAWRS